MATFVNFCLVMASFNLTLCVLRDARREWLRRRQADREPNSKDWSQLRVGPERSGLPPVRAAKRP
ncbi:hypothetical protein [Ramlibacter humi]|uniref:Uncharacterized protein n=1 Tax=Ramlibacter humi TaxID=2530451 RepID=A0A4Z0BL72_9BURK|nr:hypothetical protein [Ramlibacter humi]TFY99007.1 hypothetical protein EZ216_15705 [Ramlibacter humi]